MKICDHGYSDDECPCLAEFRAKLEVEIPNAPGKAAVFAVGADPDQDRPTFATTIGLREQCGYELIICGGDAEGMVSLMNVVVQRIRSGYVPNTTGVDDYILAGAGNKYPLRFYRCQPDAARDYVREASRYYGNTPTELVQLVVCDPNGRFPEDPQCLHRYRNQTLAGLYASTPLEVHALH